MPQLVAFFFINQVSLAFLLLVVKVYILWKYLLPKFVHLFISRLYIIKDYLIIISIKI